MRFRKTQQKPNYARYFTLHHATTHYNTILNTSAGDFPQSVAAQGFAAKRYQTNQHNARQYFTVVCQVSFFKLLAFVFTVHGLSTPHTVESVFFSQRQDNKKDDPSEKMGHLCRARTQFHRVRAAGPTPAPKREAASVLRQDRRAPSGGWIIHQRSANKRDKRTHLVQMKTKCSLSCYLQRTDIHSPPSLLELNGV